MQRVRINSLAVALRIFFLLLGRCLTLLALLSLVRTVHGTLYLALESTFFIGELDVNESFQPPSQKWPVSQYSFYLFLQELSYPLYLIIFTRRHLYAGLVGLDDLQVNLKVEWYAIL